MTNQNSGSNTSKSRQQNNNLRFIGEATPGYKIVGRVKDAQGIKGEIFITLFAGECEWLKQLQEVRLKQLETLRIFELEKARKHKNGMVVKVKECNDRNQAEALKGCMFEIPESFLVSRKGEALYLQEILGFEIVDRALGGLGLIHGFGTNGAQDLLLTKFKGAEIMVPFVKPFIEKIDYASKKIFMNLPEGLVGDSE